MEAAAIIIGFVFLGISIKSGLSSIAESIENITLAIEDNTRED